MKLINRSKQPTSNSQQSTKNGTQPKSDFKQYTNNDGKQAKSNSIEPKCTM